MKPKAVIKLILDALMTIALFLLMGYQYWGEMPHEIIGVGIFVLFIAHHILNLRWHKNLFKGKYNAMRSLTLLIDFFVFTSMLIQMYSGIVISNYVFSFLPLTNSFSSARQLHILGSYWGFVFMSLHLGLHWNMILNTAKMSSRKAEASKSRKIISFIAGLSIAGYGVWAFVKRGFPTYLFLKSEFVFLDNSEPKILFYIDYLAIMGLFIFISHYGAKLIKRLKNKTKKPQ